jgi:ankyrin repeat protein
MKNKLAVKTSVINILLSLLLLLGCKSVSLNMQDEKDIPPPPGEEMILSILRENNLLDNPNEALFWALKNNKLEVAEWLIIRKSINVNEKDWSGWTLLHRTAYNGHTSVAELLLKSGAKVNEKDDSGLTPLHRAAQYGKTEVAELLLKSGANVNEKDNYGLTSLHLAAYWGKTEVAELLLKSGANVNEKDNDGCTPLKAGIDYGENDVAGLLRRYGGVE